MYIIHVMLSQPIASMEIHFSHFLFLADETLERLSHSKNHFKIISNFIDDAPRKLPN